jgi:hypothetical protein
MDQEKKQLIVFGYGLTVIFSIISVHLFRHHAWHAAHALLLPAIVILLVLTTANYSLLKPFYKQWMKAAHFIGSIITGVILSILFYVVFGIAGIILRLIRKDLLDRQIDPAVNSYWRSKDQIAFEKSDYTRQF